MNIKPVMAKDETGDMSIRGRVFYPYERVEEIFSRMETARDTPGERTELLIFYRRMKRLHWAVYGEAVEDAEFVREITGGARCSALQDGKKLSLNRG
jgi:hypothetical protein